MKELRAHMYSVTGRRLYYNNQLVIYRADEIYTQYHKAPESTKILDLTSLISALDNPKRRSMY